MIAGVDEAGRGPVLGPMVLCGILLRKNELEKLSESGVKDSKLLSPQRRAFLAKIIEQRASKIEIIELSPSTIDKLRLNERLGLNEVEAKNFARILDELKPEIAYVDSPDPNPDLFKKRLSKYLKHKPKLVVENFADRKYTVVGAASIIAKVRRDERIAELQRKYGQFGSGYSSDPTTISFLRKWVLERGHLPEFARKSWKTAKRIIESTGRGTVRA